MKKLTFAVTVLVMAICVSAMAVTPVAPGAPGTVYQDVDFEVSPYGITGSGSGATFTMGAVAESAPFTIGESNSWEFIKPAAAGNIFIYTTGGTAPSALGYVIESVFRVNSSHSSSGMLVMKSFQMSASFWADTIQGASTFDLKSWQSGIQTISLSTDEWHTIQGVRVNAGANDYMDYFIDGVYWRSSGEGITTGVYNKRMDIGFDTSGSDYGSMHVDHLMIYDPIPEPGTMLLLGTALLALRRKK